MNFCKTRHGSEKRKIRKQLKPKEHRREIYTEYSEVDLNGRTEGQTIQNYGVRIQTGLNLTKKGKMVGKYLALILLNTEITQKKMAYASGREILSSMECVKVLRS